MEIAMKVFRVYNGMMGFSAVHRIVVAESSEEAVKMVVAAVSVIKDTWSNITKLSAEEVVLIDGVEVEDYD
jgi:hypothetical protein